jgi:hypothetical protein
VGDHGRAIMGGCSWAVMGGFGWAVMSGWAGGAGRAVIGRQFFRRFGWAVFLTVWAGGFFGALGQGVAQAVFWRFVSRLGQAV